MTDDIDDATRVTVPGHVFTRGSGGETVLMSLESEQYFALVGAGIRLWEHVSASGGVTVGELIATMQMEFDVDPAVLRNDVQRMVQELAGRGLVTTA